MDSNWLMHYPVWNLDVFGGGFLVALIAVVHVYVAHFAVGGGLFLVLTEMKGYRENSQPILDYTKRHSKFFMLLTMVFGSVTGVGIWFVISLLSPSATSVLIHHFVFGWATEWVFFAGEITTLFVYYYTFGKMNPRQHLIVGWLYFIFAWLSLFVINGIVAFMLTPGQWLETENFWHGFFNPSFLPALFFRTCMAFMLAGLFGFITSVFIKEKAFRQTMTRYCAWWLIVPFLFLLEAAYWYATTLPAPQYEMIFSRSPEILPFLKAFLWISPVIFIIGVLMAIRVPVAAKKGLVVVLVVIGLMYMGAFEWIREAGRRPFLIYGHTYSTSVLAKDLEAIQEQGLLKSARWVKHREITDANAMEAGQEIFRMLCISCHSVRGPMNDILPLTRKFSVFGMDAMLDGMGKINTYMPQFMGNAKERKALAQYIVNGLHEKGAPAEIPGPSPIPVEMPEFDPDADPYVILAWAGKGMHFISDCDRQFTLSPPGSDIFALLIRRGETPERVSEDIRMVYHVEGGKSGGKLSFDDDMEAYTVNLPLSPYTADGEFMPYPLVTIEARDAASGERLASTRVSVGVSTEMGCKSCHGGEWRVRDIAGISDETANDILAVHDRMSKTKLLEAAQNGQPQDCRECHSESEHLNLSAAIHGFHANYLTGQDAESCGACHPSSPDGFTKGFRGIHKEIELDCTSCHGKLEDHALSLLVAEKAAGKKGTEPLMKHLSPRAVESLADIAPRQPRINMPDCLNCHVEFDAPETDTHEFNQWTEGADQRYHRRTDDAAILCAACHGAPHAVYPANNIFGNDRDNIPPMQHQDNPYPIAANKNCKVCHTIDMEDEIHHPNSLNMFRNTR